MSEPVDLQDLKAQAASGVMWTATSTITVVSIQIAQMLILPHFVSPESYGLVAMAQIIAGFAYPFADLGVSAAIIQRQHATPEQLSSLYWVNVLMGLSLGILVLVSSPLVALLYGEPRVLLLMPLAAAPFAVIPWGQQFQMLLQKQLNFRRLAMFDISGATVGFLVSVTLAVAGLQTLAILIGPLCGVSTKATLLTMTGWTRWRPSFRLKLRDLDGFLSFGAFQMAERAVNYTNTRIDQLVIGSIVGVQPLGYYNLGYQYVMAPMTLANPMLTNVAFPIFAKVQTDNEQLRAGYTRLLRMVMVVNTPLMLGILAVAHRLVPLAAGEEWAPAVPIVQLLSIVGLFRATGNPVGTLLWSKGRSDLGFWWNIGFAAVSLPTCAIAAWLYGIHGVAWALIAIQIVASPLNYLLLRGLIGPFGRKYVAAIAKPVLVGLVMAAVVYGTGALAPASAHRWVDGLELLGLVLLGAVTYVGLSYYVLPDEVSLVRTTLLARSKGGAQ